MKSASDESIADSIEQISDPQQILNLVTTSLDDDKAENVVVIDLEGKSSVADYLVIASGRSARHVSALADHVLRTLKEAGMGRLSTEGLAGGDWILIDATDVIVHLFRPEVREFYDLEKIWSVRPPTSSAKT